MPKRKSNADSRIEDFLTAVERNFKTVDPQNFWPLNGGQIDAYFADTQAAEIYDKIYALRKKGLTNKEIASFFRQPVILRYFLIHHGILGLKVCDALKIRHFSVKERINYTLLLFDLLEGMVKDDIFCLNGTNLIYSQEEIDSLLVKNEFKNIEDNRRMINNLVVSLFHLCNALYYDIFVGVGLEIHGPYKTDKVFGKGTFLVIRDYFDLKPKILWPRTTKQIPWTNIRLMLIYKDTDWQINFFNQPYSKKGIGQYLKYFSLLVDGKKISDLDKIEELDFLAEELTLKQTKLVKSLKPLEQARKGAEMSYYMLRDLYTYFGEKPSPTPTVGFVFKKYGDEFIKRFAQTKNYPVSYYKRLFDPRNNFIGD